MARIISKFPKLNRNFMKKSFWLMLLVNLLAVSCAQTNTLPKPELESGIRGTLFGIDKNINESTLDKYLFRHDVNYRDVRMLVDPANYGAIGGDSYLSGFVQGFEVAPFPYIAPVTDLPEEVGIGYDGPTLFSFVNNQYVANYQESLDIVHNLFPRDKALFLMCGGGGYAGMMKSFLIAIGYDTNKIYNVGGYWYYEGNYNVEVKRIDVNNQVIYDFYKVAYHDISDFSNFTPIES